MRSLRILVSAGLLTGGLAGVSAALGASAGATLGTLNCTPAHLRVSIASPQGAAGTIYYPIVFTDIGAACSVWGVPRVQPVLGGPSRSHLSVGPAARNLSMGEMPVRRVLQTGQSVSDAFGVTESGNYSASTCRAKSAGGVVISLATFVHPTYVALKISVCTKIVSTTTRLIVRGTTGA